MQWRYNTQEPRTIKDTPYHLTFGQHPCVGISNLPIAPDILKTLSTESELMDLYSNLKSRMRFESPTKPQSIPKSLEPAFEGGESVGEEKETSVGATTDTVLGTKRSYSTTEESHALRRAMKAV